MIQTELSNKRFTLKQGDQLTVTKDYRKGLELKTVNTLKLDKTVNQELRIKLENQIEIVKWIEKNI